MLASWLVSFLAFPLAYPVGNWYYGCEGARWADEEGWVLVEAEDVRTVGMWLPQPNHVAFSVLVLVKCA